MKMVKTMVIAAIAASSTVVLAQTNVVAIDGVQSTTIPSSGQQTLNKATPDADIALDKRYTMNEVEDSVETARDAMKSAVNKVKSMQFAKANPVSPNVQHFDQGAPKDLLDMHALIGKYLKADQDNREERDEKAMARIDGLPIWNTDYTLPTDTEINVIGGSSIQAYPIRVDGEIIGHFRVACGGYLQDDVLINNDSVSYCVSSMMTTGVTRNSGVHKDSTTKLFFVGVSEPYMVGKVSKVKINWSKHPKSTTAGMLKFYNIDKVPHAVGTLDYNTNVTMSDGTVLAGTHALISK